MQDRMFKNMYRYRNDMCVYILRVSFNLKNIRAAHICRKGGPIARKTFESRRFSFDYDTRTCLNEHFCGNSQETITRLNEANWSHSRSWRASRCRLVRRTRGRVQAVNCVSPSLLGVNERPPRAGLLIKPNEAYIQAYASRTCSPRLRSTIHFRSPLFDLFPLFSFDSYRWLISSSLALCSPPVAIIQTLFEKNSRDRSKMYFIKHF